MNQQHLFPFQNLDAYRVARELHPQNVVRHLGTCRATGSLGWRARRHGRSGPGCWSHPEAPVGCGRTADGAAPGSP